MSLISPTYLGDDYSITPTNFLYQPIGVYYKNISPEEKFYWGGTGLLLTPEINLDLSESSFTFPSGQTVYSYIWGYLASGYRLTRVSSSPTANMYINWDLGIQTSHACQQLIWGTTNKCFRTWLFGRDYFGRDCSFSQGINQGN